MKMLQSSSGIRYRSGTVCSTLKAFSRWMMVLCGMFQVRPV